MATKYLVESGANGTTHFSTIYQWLASLPTTLTEVERLEIASDFSYAHGVSNSDNLSSGFITAADKYLEIYVPPEYRHDGRPRSVSSKGFRITGTVAYSLGAKHARLNGAEIDITDASASAIILASGANSDVRVENCLIHNSATGSVPTISVGANGVLFRGNVVYGSGRSWDSRGATSVVVENCDFWRHADQFGVLADSGTTFKNCYSGKSGGTQNDFWLGGSPTGSNNASSDTTATTLFTSSIASAAGSAVFTSVSSGSENFNLLAGTNDLVDTGIAIAGRTSDARGTSVPQGTATDIGALERFTAQAATKPSTPTGVTATGGPGYVDVTGSVASDGGSAITSYTATLSDGKTATSATLPVRITGTTAGVAVTATLVATNSVGSSDPSAASASTTPTAAPAAPTANITSVSVDGQTVTVSGTTTGIPTSGLATITAQSGGAVQQGPKSITLGSGTFSVVFTAVPPGTYSQTVTVYNSAAPSGVNANGAQPFTIASIDGNPEAPSNVSVTIKLCDDNFNPLASLTNLKWSWFDQTDISALNAPTDQGASGVTDVDGNFTVELINTTKLAGEVGTLIVSNSDGNPATLHKAFTGPVTVQ